VKDKYTGGDSAAHSFGFTAAIIK